MLLEGRGGARAKGSSTKVKLHITLGDRERLSRTP